MGERPIYSNDEYTGESIILAHRFSMPRLLQSVALLTALIGVVIWSTLLFSQQSSTLVTSQTALSKNLDNPALQWFANRPIALDIKVLGVMAAKNGAVAILRVNDDALEIFLVGEHLRQGGRVADIEADAVVIERGTESIRLITRQLPEGPVLPELTRQQTCLIEDCVSEGDQ